MLRQLLSVLATLSVSGTLAVSAGESTAKTTLTIKGMTCGGCVAAVRHQLKNTEGVTAYEVSLDKGEAEVTFEPAKTEPKKIAESVSRTGFAASVKGMDDSSKGTSTLTTPEAPSVKDGHLDPWEPIDATFKGCSEGVCGMRGRNAQAVRQPGAQLRPIRLLSRERRRLSRQGLKSSSRGQWKDLVRLLRRLRSLSRAAPRPRAGAEGPVAVRRALRWKAAARRTLTCRSHPRTVQHAGGRDGSSNESR